MRWPCHRLIALLIAGAVSLPSTAMADERPVRPIRAQVTSLGAAVRSGPAETYYLTDTLPEETLVEVYRRQPDGWCAIRPPADSFSWVFAEHVSLIGDGIAEIKKDNVAARVGSRLSAQRDVVQVKLKMGETVAVLGRDERDGGLWYRIAPPAGEFRWVRAQDIGLAKHVAEENVEGDGYRVTMASLEKSIERESKSGDVTVPPLAATNAGSESAPAPTPGKWAPAKSTPLAADITPLGSAAASTAGLAAQLADLELRLSRMVSEPPRTWNIAPLERAAEQLLANSNTVAERQAVKVTLAKIDRFAGIQRKYMQANPSIASAPMGVAATGVGAMSGMATSPANATTSAYDAVGTLRPVVSRRPGAPQFALVNEQGQVVTFVTSSPDVNLQPYVGQRIGVSGSRGYIPEFRRAHVTAGRVTPMDGRMLR